MENMIFVFVGTTGVGKTHYSKYVLDKYGLTHIKSITTRPPRDKNSNEYIHLSKEEFEELIQANELIEYTTFDGNYYGKRKQDVLAQLETGHCLLTMTPDRIPDLKKQIPQTVFIHLTMNEPIIENTVRRLSDRKLTENELKTRIETVMNDLNHISRAKSLGFIDHEVMTIEGDHTFTYKSLDEIISKYLFAISREN